MVSSAQSTALSSAYPTGHSGPMDSVRQSDDVAGRQGSAIAQPTGLSGRDAAILDFERHWWRYSGAKEQSIRETFDMTPAHYHQVLSALLENPDALAYDPILVKRLLRLRDARHQARSARRVAN